MKTQNLAAHLPDSNDAAVARRRLAELEPSAYDETLPAACRDGDLELARLLLAAGADVEAKGRYGMTPLHRAAYNGLTEAVRLLSAAGADVNAVDRRGHTPLYYAAEKGDTDAVRLLLEAGGSIQAALDKGWNKLHFAASAGLADKVRELLEAGADPNTGTWAGNGSALLSAAANGHTEVVRLLLEAGADPNAVDCEGYHAVNVAEEKEFTEIADMLYEYGGVLLEE